MAESVNLLIGTSYEIHYKLIIILACNLGTWMTDYLLCDNLHIEY